MEKTINEAQQIGQSAWLDFISRGLMTSGRFQRLVEQGVTGMTSNPTIFQKAITDSKDYDESILSILGSNRNVDTRALYDKLVIEDIRMAADILRPVYGRTGGIDGLVSLEPPAQLSYDTAATISEVRRLWSLVQRPNVMMKVPATPEGIAAVEELIAEGVNINITLMFSMKHYEAVAEAFLRGIARCRQPEKITSVASFFVSRLDSYVDKELEKIGSTQALALRGKTAVANSKLVYHRFRKIFSGDDFQRFAKRGVRLQRVLWGSTSTKNPAYDDLLYVNELIGPDTVNTMPLDTLEAFIDHGKVRRSVEENIEESFKIMDELGKMGIDINFVTEKLQKDGVNAFCDSLDRLLEELEKKRKSLVRA